jgi:hypothetical protein
MDLSEVFRLAGKVAELLEAHQLFAARMHFFPALKTALGNGFEVVVESENDLVAVDGTTKLMNIVSRMEATLFSNPAVFTEQDMDDFAAELRATLRLIDPGQASPPQGELSREARAILFVQDHLKTTGRLPTKKQIAEHLDITRRTLGNWRAFKSAYHHLEKQYRKAPPKGFKDADGNLEAWRDSGKKST